MLTLKAITTSKNVEINLLFKSLISKDQIITNEIKHIIHSNNHKNKLGGGSFHCIFGGASAAQAGDILAAKASGL